MTRPPPPVTLLQVRVVLGLEDDSLMGYVENLENMRTSSGLSKGEARTLALCVARLDALTQPQEE